MKAARFQVLKIENACNNGIAVCISGVGTEGWRPEWPGYRAELSCGMLRSQRAIPPGMTEHFWQVLGRNRNSIEMEYFFHLRPPFSLFASRQWILHGTHDCPPFLGFRVFRHLCPVFRDVCSVVLEIS